MLHHFELDQLLLVLLLITVALVSYCVGRRASIRASIRYTTLPELRFNFRRLVIDNAHSSSCSTPRTYPRIDLARFEPWQTFATDIRTAIMDAMETQGVAVGTTITFGGVFEEQEELVANEQDVHQTADTELHKAAIKVLKALGAPGRFYRSGTGPIEIIGVPDFCWIHAGTRHPKLVVCKSIIFSLPFHLTTCSSRRSSNQNGSLISGTYQRPCRPLTQLIALCPTNSVLKHSNKYMAI
jgi:hypothetical protein